MFIKYIFIILSLLAVLGSEAQQQEQINKIRTVIDNRNGSWLDSLVEIAANKRIVALGEDTHGTGEFYELRTAITERLIQEKGFNVVILENPHEDMMALQDGLQVVNIDTLMRRHLFSIYQTKQMKEFLEWFKKYSQKRKGLRLAGCDDSFRELLPQSLLKEAAVYNNKDLDSLCQEYLLRQTLSIGDFYNRYPSLKPASLPNEMQFGVATYRLLERIDSLLERQVVQNPKLRELVFHAKTAYMFYDRVSRKVRVSRDEIMGERINYHAADRGAKIIVWAHNAHIAKSAWLDNELGLMGATVLQKFPGDYLAIGMNSGGGTYSYIRNRFINDDHQFTDTLYNDIQGGYKAHSWNELLAANDSPDYFLDLSKLSSPDRGEFARKRSLKMMGYGKQTTVEKDFYDVSLVELFDVLIFLKKTNHTTPVFN